MLRNEERLYHIFVSFPVVCDKQFLILKFKRNEAICCLIGFGIGISCCLMYRWFKASFHSLTSLTKLQLEKEISSESKHLIATDFIGNSQIVSSIDNIKQAKLNRSRKLRLHKNNRSGMSSSSSCNSIQSTRSVHSNDNFDEPLNDVYQNLSKFLNKQFCRNIKLRKPAKRQQRQRTPEFQTNLNFDFKTISNNNIKNDTRDFKQVTNKPCQGTVNSTQYIDKYLNPSYTNNPSYSYIRDASTPPKMYQKTPLSSASIFSRPKLNSFGHLTNDYFEDDIFSTTSHRSSVFDLDDFSECKFISSKPDVNSVDQTLDEALNQINRLKEDMNGLCEDLDTLYNTNTTPQADNYNLVSKDHDFSSDSSDIYQLDESVNIINDFESNKCHCLYSYLNRDILFDFENLFESESITSQSISKNSLSSSSTFRRENRFRNSQSNSSLSLISNGCRLKALINSRMSFCNLTRRFSGGSRKKLI